MQAAMPFQIETSTVKSYKTDKAVDLNNKSNKNFNKILDNEIENNSSNNENINDNLVEEVAEMVRQVLSHEELELMNDDELKSLLESLISENNIDPDSLEIESFLNDIKKIMNKESFIKTSESSNVININDLKEEVVQIDPEKVTKDIDSSKTLQNANFKMQLEGMAKLIIAPELMKSNANSEMNKIDSLFNKDNFNLLTNNSNEMSTDSIEKIEVLKVEKTDDILKLVDMINVAKSGKATKLTVQLTPAELGKVNIQLTEVSGKITAKFIVENDHTKSLLLQQADAIKNQLAEKGIVIDDMDFMFMGDFNSREQFSRQGDNSSNDNTDKESSGFIKSEQVEDDIDTGLYA